MHRAEGRGPCLTQFQRSECKQCKHQRADPEADDDLGFAPAELLKVMVQRRHLKDAFSLAQLVAAHLQDDRERLQDKDAADKGQQQFLPMMMATVPMAPPSASEPTSPIKISAGWALYQRKPMDAPTMDPQKMVSSPTRGIRCSSR